MSCDTVFFNDDFENLEERAGDHSMAEVIKLKELLAEKEKEITRLQRETHKLKSVIEKSELRRVPSLSTSNTVTQGSTHHKKCGVSGESWGARPGDKSELAGGVEPQRHHKDFRTRTLIRSALGENDFLQNLDGEQIRDMADFMFPQQFSPGDFIIREGDAGSHLFVSAEGQLQVSQGTRNLGVIKPGVAFGELALLYNCKRTASVRAISECKVWALERRAFQLAMVKAGLQRMKDRVNFLKHVPLLRDLDLSVLSRIADCLEVEHYPTGTYIIREGSAGDNFFIISQGSVRVTTKSPPTDDHYNEPYTHYGKPYDEENCSFRESTSESKNQSTRVLRDLNPGDFFGEQALLTEERRSANVISLSPGVEVLTLDRESFLQLIGGMSEFNELRKRHLLKCREAQNEGLIVDLLSEDVANVQICEEGLISSSIEKQIELSSSEGVVSITVSSAEAVGITVESEDDTKLESGVITPDYSKLTLDDLEFVCTLGVGGFGRVELVRITKQPSKVFALKCMSKVHVSKTQQQDHVYAEKNIMMACNSPFICRLYTTFKDSKYIYLLMEACLGGEVWTHLRDKGAFDEDTTRFIAGCVLLALDYLHGKDIVYRDLKPENLMVDNVGYIKLVDFGFSKIVPKDQRTWTFCGTPEYCSPETILNRGHDRMVDYWSLGILLFELLTGSPPWGPMAEGESGNPDMDPLHTYNSILKGIDGVTFTKNCSRASISLIRRLCRQAPGERLGANRGIRDVVSHRWFQGFDWNGLTNRSMTPAIIPNLKSPTDTSYFDRLELEVEDVPCDFSGWDEDF